MSEWHYEKNGQRLTLPAEPELQTLIEEGVIHGQTLVWKQGLPAWTPLAETDLASHLNQRQSPPPLPAKSINHRLVWVLAFAPLIGLMLEAMAAGMFASSSYTVDYEVTQALKTNQYWYLTLILNISLSLWDEKRLKQAGIDTSAFGKTAFIVPVYLWKRAQALRQGPAYFWTWIGMFAFTLLV